MTTDKGRIGNRSTCVGIREEWFLARSRTGFKYRARDLWEGYEKLTQSRGISIGRKISQKKNDLISLAASKERKVVGATRVLKV